MPTLGTIPTGAPVFGAKPNNQFDSMVPLPGHVGMFGHSYLDFLSGYANSLFQTNGGAVDFDQSLAHQILGMFGLAERQCYNNALGGSKLIGDNTDTLGFTGFRGGHVQVLQSIFPVQIRTNAGFIAPYNSPNGLAITCYGINDILAWAATNVASLMRKAYKEAYRTVFSRLRTAAVYEALTDTGVFTTFSGGGLGGADWSSQASTTTCSGTGFARCTTTGKTVTIAVPADYDGGGIGLGFLGRKGATGGTATITIDGAIVDTINTSNQIADTAGGFSAPTALVITRRYQLPRGAHTIVITTTAIDTNFDYNFWQVESQVPNPIIAMNAAKLRTYSAAGVTDAMVDDWNQALYEVVSEFAGPIQVADFDSALGLSVGQSAFTNNRISYDGLHPSELGARFGAAAVWQAWVRCTQTMASLGNVITSRRDDWAIVPTSQITVGQYLQSPPLNNSGGTLALTVNELCVIPIIVNRPCNVDNIVFDGVTAVGTGSVRLGLYLDKGPNLSLTQVTQGPINLMYDWGAFTLTVATPKSFALPAGKQKIVAPGLYWVAIVLQTGSTATVNAQGGTHPMIAAPSGGLPRPTHGAGYAITQGGGFNGALPAGITYVSAAMALAVKTTVPHIALSVSQAA